MPLYFGLWPGPFDVCVCVFVFVFVVVFVCVLVCVFDFVFVFAFLCVCVCLSLCARCVLDLIRLKKQTKPMTRTPLPQYPKP